MTTPHEKIVISVGFYGDTGTREAVTRARLLRGALGFERPPDEELTAVGRQVLAALAAVDGLKLLVVNPHAVRFGVVHPALWSLDEVERGVVAAFTAALGVELEVVRDIPTT